ncbi:MAG TPA: phosphoglucomutase (alpha-D-glucose-1,6-bisphosphate-dependent) [Rudaea sp.]|jgi:phosphoglucomutase|uniref:phosphoglucomutase (alpha-D-glucose-1,6-bisphosphate-dependent) n=1 Tax=Rudaea sp. TaxID=2136325 RepID=UPI002F93C080
MNATPGQLPPESALENIPRLITAYYTGKPDPAITAQRVAFGTSGHRGSSLRASFNDAHIAAVSQAVCTYRKNKNIDGPLFIGVDTHALSEPAFATALEVLAANGIETMIAAGGEYTPTPAISHSILVYNGGRSAGLADGIVITPSHNPPEDGGFKYNPPNGGPADTDATGWIETEANRLIEGGLVQVRRMPYAQARRAPTTHEHDFLGAYVDDLHNAVDMDVIRGSGIKLGADPLGGAGVHYWARIAEQYKLDLTVVSETVDPTFRFMSLDWDGRIRMDPSSSFAMQRLIGLKDRFDVAFACDTDHDRHGIVARSVGLLPANNYLAVAIDYLFRNRPRWRSDAAVGKTAVSSAMIDRVAARLGRRLYETPVGLKWFVDGLLDGSLGFGGEESAGATFTRIDGTVWTTDKDGIAAALLSAEITARSGRDPGEYYRDLTQVLGEPKSSRVDARANTEQKKKLSQLTPEKIQITELAGEKVQHVLDRAPGNNGRIGGIKVMAENGWFAARPSGTEDIYKIYAESFIDDAHLKRILSEAQSVVDKTIGAG